MTKTVVFIVVGNQKLTPTIIDNLTWNPIRKCRKSTTGYIETKLY
jgi:hypothetical protein